MLTVYRHNNLSGYIFLLPLFLFMAGFILVPVVGTLLNSFYKDVPFLQSEFNGLDNYRNLGGDSSFWQSLRFSLLFVMAAVPLELLLGMVFALVLHKATNSKALLWAAVLIPWAIPSAVSARVWGLIYNYNYGLANSLLTKFGLTTEPINWLGGSFSAFWAVTVADVWKTTPFVAIIILAGLQAVPDDFHESAKIDGAGFIRRFFSLTLPLLKPVIVVALLFRTIDSLRVFDVIYVLTGGGPGGATSALSLYGYEYYLIGDFGYASTISVVLFVIAMALSILYIRFSRFERE